MAWRIACFCGRVFDCVPPDICPRCGHLIEDPGARWERDQAQDEIGYTTAEDALETGEAW